ncbi:MAG TPA: 3'-5' exonuclease, partial [Candidatus Krumholzibacteria bacterium]|nr:3'-5' exonuclease [Candidatus Krumholzibacteria bacterium]
DRWVRARAREAGVAPLPRGPLATALVGQVRAALLGRGDLPEDVTEGDFTAELHAAAARFAGEGLDGVAALLDPPGLAKIGPDIEDLRAKIAAAATAEDVRASLLTADGKKARDCTKKGAADLKALVNGAVVDAAADLFGILRRLDLVALYRKNRACLVLGLRVLDIFDALKRRDRVVDFADLEDMACRLMDDRSRALSLLFRLEDSLRHLLLDEFQDTNENQRDILLPFIREFLSTAGGDEPGQPTVFVVGDLKQSIYAFRGAEPGIFAAMIDLIERHGQASLTLPTNFRSQAAVVDGVGLLFTADPLAATLPPGERDHVHQRTARPGPGEVVVLPRFESDEDGGYSGDQRAAFAAARIVRHLVDSGGTTTGRDGTPRPLAWSDVLVLFRTRTGVSLYEQAFLDAGIPIEPAGRGMLAASREVQDVLALLRWLVWPEDDVSLATVLRSPVARLPEAAFQRLLAARGLFNTAEAGRWRTPAGLWRTLQDRAAVDPVLADVAARLKAWRDDTGYVAVHELMRRIYREGQLPERYEAAGGPQARTNLERLYDLALSPSLAGTPTVRRFIDLVDKAGRRGGHEEGAAGEAGQDGRVRLMTIHGAKGLEAPVVLLVDADRTQPDRNNRIRLDRATSDAGLVFGATQAYRRPVAGTEHLLAGDDLLLAADAAAEARAVEDTNLLYVALTRARDRLYVLGGKGREKEETDAADSRSFLRRLRAAAVNAGDPPVSLEDPPFLVRPVEPLRRPAVPPGAADGPEAWTPPTLAGGVRIVTPSAVSGHDDASGPTLGAMSGRAATVHADAADHGRKVHLMLQLATERGSLPAGFGPAGDEAAGVLGDPRLAWIFDPGTAGGRGLSEVPIVLRRAGPGDREERVTGVIDRLIIRANQVDVVDYKTNRWGGDPARKAWLIEHYQPQLAAYAEAARALFPGRPVRTWLLLTDPEGRSTVESGLVEIAM